MPHLSEMQKRYADDGVTIIGVSKEDQSNSLEAVRKMTADKGDTMAYTVAWDDEGQTYADYMRAAGQGGIPTAFLVDRAGKIAFIGHPAEMDIPLAKVVAGTWDLVEGPKEIQEQRDARREIGMGAMGATKPKAIELLAKIDAFAKRWPDQAGMLDATRYGLLVTAERADEAALLGRRIVEAAIEKADPNALNAFAWGLVDPALELSSRDLGLALYAATVASNLTDNADPSILDTLARCHFELGGLDRAIELQQAAVAAAKQAGTGERLTASLEETLETYRAAK